MPEQLVATNDVHQSIDGHPMLYFEDDADGAIIELSVMVLRIDFAIEESGF